MDSEVFKAYEKLLVDSHDQLLLSTLETGSYKRLCSFKHIVNGFAVHTTPSQVLSNYINFLSFFYELVNAHIYWYVTERNKYAKNIFEG